MPKHDELLTSSQAGVLLGKSARTVTRMADAGLLPVAVQLPGSNGAKLYRTADVKARAAAMAKAAAA